MLCYFDSDDNVNLSHIDQIKNVRSLYEVKKRLLDCNVEFVTSTEYTRPGIYLIEVSKVPYLWCAKTFSSSSNILLNIPSKVIRAAKQKQIRIVILSIVEGDNFNTNFTDGYFEGYLHLNNNVKLLGLPQHSVVIVSGNLNAAAQYTRWCEENNQQESIEFLEGIEWNARLSLGLFQTSPIFDESRINLNAKSFSSLNRAHRPARTEHLFYLAENKLLDNLVSGGAWFGTNPIDPPKYQQVDYDHYKKVLFQNYPRTVDVEDLVNTVPNHTNNFEIYKNTLLSVITESHYDQQGGLFITEKTFRPLLVGHPFMILGQRGILNKLQSWGFRTDFLDNKYDSIADDRLRFISFHETLHNWYNLPTVEKYKLAEEWRSIVEHNFYHYKTINFKKIMFDRVAETTQKYFQVS